MAPATHIPADASERISAAREYLEAALAHLETPQPRPPDPHVGSSATLARAADLTETALVQVETLMTLARLERISHDLQELTGATRDDAHELAETH